MLTKNTSQAELTTIAIVPRHCFLENVAGNDDVRSKKDRYGPQRIWHGDYRFRREAQCCVARPGCKHLGLRDLVHEFHASRQLDGSGSRATSRLCQEIQ